MPLIYLLVLGVVVLSASYYNKDVFSPVRVFICTYSLLLAVNSLKLSNLQTPWALTTHLLFWGALFFFIAGGSLILLVNRVLNPAATIDFRFIQGRITSDANTTDWEWFYKVWLFCAIVFVVSYGVSAIVSKGIPLFAPDGDKLRLKFFGATEASNYGLFFGPLSLVLVSELLFFGSLRGKRRIVIFVSGVITLLMYITVLTRLDLFRFSLFAIIMYHYGKKKLTIVQLLGVFALSIVFFFALFLIRVRFTSLGMLMELRHLQMHKDYLWCANIYAYIANNFWNMDFAFRKFVDGSAAVPQEWGFDLSRAFLYLAHLSNSLENSFMFDSIMNESIMKAKGLNTVVFVWHFFKDFGVYGVYVLPLVFGMAAASFYVNSINSPTLFRFAMWSLIAPAIILSYSVPLWEFWFVYLNVIVLAVAHKKIRIAT